MFSVQIERCAQTLPAEHLSQWNSVSVMCSVMIQLYFFGISPLCFSTGTLYLRHASVTCTYAESTTRVHLHCVFTNDSAVSECLFIFHGQNPVTFNISMEESSVPCINLPGLVGIIMLITNTGFSDIV